MTRSLATLGNSELKRGVTLCESRLLFRMFIDNQNLYPILQNFGIIINFEIQIRNKKKNENNTKIISIPNAFLDSAKICKPKMFK